MGGNLLGVRSGFKISNQNSNNNMDDASHKVPLSHLDRTKSIQRSNGKRLISSSALQRRCAIPR